MKGQVHVPAQRWDVLARLPVWKGHGTENDFIVIDDRDARLVLDSELVSALCDRRSGVGGDGVLRVLPGAPTTSSDAASARPPAGLSRAAYFMDYRNADGSMAEMCGNGARVFARYLVNAGLVDTDTFLIGTRAGDVDVRMENDGDVSVDLGPAKLLAASPVVSVRGLAGGRGSTAVTMPNPHVVVELDSPAQLESLDLSAAPAVVPQLPAGQNVEFVVRTAPRRLSLRVHERGSGETRSCGTGIAAAVVAVQSNDRSSQSTDDRWQVDVPGGTVFATWDGRARVRLTGPAVLVARVVVDTGWLHALAGSQRTHFADS